MWTFGIPSSLKAWIDHVVRAGKTFNYVGGAVEGLAKGKKAILVLASGGIFSEGALEIIVIPFPLPCLPGIGPSLTKYGSTAQLPLVPGTIFHRGHEWNTIRDTTPPMYLTRTGIRSKSSIRASDGTSHRQGMVADIGDRWMTSNHSRETTRDGLARA